MVAIIILNWNGFNDTIGCLKSLYKMINDDFCVILGDNGSTNESLKEISSYLQKSKFSYSSIQDLNSHTISSISERHVYLCNLKENFGFAKGNNILIKFARQFRPDYFLLLNNDTEVEPTFLSKLLDFQSKKNEYRVLTPLIRYYKDKNVIWNAGGKLFWGFRKYFYADKNISLLKDERFIKITFITGCALFVPNSMVSDDGIFTEQFFHGEEDFDFSYRMKSQNVKMACVLDSHIYHKVNASTNTKSSIGRTYIHYLNRYINMKMHMNCLSYYMWKKVNNVYIRYLLKRKGYSRSESSLFLQKVNKRSELYDSVTQCMFIKSLNAQTVSEL